MNDEAMVRTDLQSEGTCDSGANVTNQESNDTKSKGTLIDAIIKLIAESVGNLCEKKAVIDTITNKMKGILATVFYINSLGEYEVGLRIDGTLYRFSDYTMIPGLQDMITASKIVVRDTASAFNLSACDRFRPSQMPLDPSRFFADLQVVMKGLRVNIPTSPCSRPQVELLQNATQYACDGSKVEDRTNKMIVFLKGKYDDEKNVDYRDWCRARANTLFPRT